MFFATLCNRTAPYTVYATIISASAVSNSMYATSNFYTSLPCCQIYFYSQAFTFKLSRTSKCHPTVEIRVLFCVPAPLGASVVSLLLSCLSDQKKRLRSRFPRVYKPPPFEAGIVEVEKVPDLQLRRQAQCIASSGQESAVF
jgi:hypothetical protein